MRNKIFFVFLFLCFLSVTFTLDATADSIQWVHSYDQALRQASGDGKPIMVDFYTDWCGWCTKLDNETYADGNVIALSKDFVCLKIDGDKERALVGKYNVRGYPTILFLNFQGKTIGGGSGFRDANRMSKEMRSILLSGRYDE